MRCRSGFTLIEVILVIVILGVMAALALPRITGQLEAVNAAEVMNVFGSIRRAFVNCTDMTNSAGTCFKSDQLNVLVAAGSKFWYQSSAWAITPAALFEAHRMVGGVENIICMWVDQTPGSETVRFGVSPANSIYSGIVQRTGAAAPGNAWLGSNCGDGGGPYQ